jgi:hypothetical protein
MTSDDSTERPPWMPLVETPDGKPTWNQDDGDLLVGQYALVGLTYLAVDGETVTSQVQCHGKITKADEHGITIACEGTTWRGQTATLPPDLRAFRPAGPGEYRLRSTGEVVKNPDLLITWTITEPSKPS